MLGCQCLLVVPSLLFGEITSYYPLVTEPSYEETSVDESFFDGNRTQSVKTNLLGLDSEGKYVMPIIPGFRGGSPLSVVSHSDGGDFNEPFDTHGKTDQSVDETGMTLWKTLAGSSNLEGGSGIGGITFESTTTYTSLGPGETPSLGVMLIRRKATIGEVVATRYLQVHESISSSEFIDLRMVDRSIVEHRAAYVGTALVTGLYPGSNPVLVTDPYTALVRVTETRITGTSESFSIDGETETSLGINDISSGPLSTIEWTVKGIGTVRLLLVSGEWLDSIMNHSIFNNGSNVVGAISLEQLIPSEDVFFEHLRASGGSLNDAADTILTDVNQEITLWPETIIQGTRPTVIDPVSQLAADAAEAGLTGDDVLPKAIPHGDNVANILKYAFNMSLSASDSQVLSVNGVSGLPMVEVTEEDQTQKFQINYIRRKNSGLIFTPLYSTLLDPGGFVAFSGPETITSIDDMFERVSVETPINFSVSGSCFGYVKVEY